MNSKKTLAPLLVIGAGICWGVIGIFSKKLTSMGLNALQITEARCLVTALCLLLFLLIKDPQKLKIALSDLPLFLGSGILSIVFFNICYFMAIEKSSLSVASILLYTAPALVSLMSAFLFKEPFGKEKCMALLLSFLGSVLTSGILHAGSADVSFLGILLGLGSGFGYALYSIFSRLALRKYHPLTVTAYTFFVAAGALFPFSGFSKLTFLIQSRPESLLFLLPLGIISTLLPFLLYTEGLRHMEAGRASIMAFVEPMVATLSGILVFHERLGLVEFLGILLIFISIVLLNRKRSTRGSVHRG